MLKPNRNAIAALAVLAMPALASAKDIEKLAGNMYESAVRSAPTAEAVRTLLADQLPDGRFKSIDYTSTSRASWKPQGHLTRLNELMNAWCAKDGEFFRSPAVRQAILSGYAHWIENDYQSSNWYYNVIGVPERLGSLMLKLQQNALLPSENFTKAIAILHRSAKEQGGASTGANLASQAACTIHEGVLRFRAAKAPATEKAAAEALIQKSYDYIGGTLAPALNLEDDGIRVDNSYQSHQQSLYDGGYGATLLGHCARVAAWGRGTGYGLSDANVRHMVNYLLDGGPQWMTRGLTYDPLASGRYWSRVGQSNTAAGLKAPIDTAIDLCREYRKPELLALRDRLADSIQNQQASSTSGPTGNRMYFVSDYMADHRPGYMISVAGVSTRTNTPESINGENLKAGYGTAGLHLIFQTGHEYDGIYAVWDWYRLPGTTSERGPDGIGGKYPILPDHHFGKTDQVGGVSDGTTGAFVYAMSEYGISATKAYFFFDAGMVALGNSIRQTSPNTAGGVVGTNLNQTLLDGPVTYCAAEGQVATLTPGQGIESDRLRWVNHANVGYLFLERAGNVLLSNQKQTGTWQSINQAGSRETVSKDVFSLDLLHGNQPADAAYAYAVLPNQTATQTEAAAKAIPFEILRNDKDVQAVRSGNRTQAIFHSNGSINLSEGVVLAKVGRETGVGVIWQAVGDKVMLSLANTDRRGGPLVLTVNQPLRGEQAAYDARTGLTTITVQPPVGHQAGSTLTLPFDIIAKGRP